MQGPMLAVRKCFPVWASRYPEEFLRLIAAMPLTPEPEILAGAETTDVILPHMLIRGSETRCPRAFWSKDLRDAAVSARARQELEKGANAK